MNIKEINDIIDRSTLQPLDKLQFVKMDEVAYSNPEDDALELGGAPADYVGLHIENSLHDYYITIYSKRFDNVLMDAGIFYRYYFPPEKKYLYGVDFYGNIYSADDREKEWDIVRFAECK